MTNSLVIVESPAKAKTIQKYLGKDYTVLASKGHIRDLPKSGLQVDIDHNYDPHYEVLEDHKPVVAEMKRAAKEADTIYLAPDPDREGEAIAWHIAHELKSAKKPMLRVEFHEITKKGVQQGLASPRTVDEKRFNAQQARRILDRLIGYELSPILWKRLCRQVNGHYLSAGRVQSAALRLIVDREDEIIAFQQQEYWPIGVELLGKTKPSFRAALVETDGRKVVVPTRDRVIKPTERVIGAQADAEAILADLRAATYSVSLVEKKERRRRAPPPYITSSLQRDAASRLGFSASRTMQVAQRLYEGIDVGAEGPVGLITYMRTDSTRIAGESVELVRAYVAQRYGKEYVPEKANFFKTKSSAQDAHEAIRPTALEHDPESIKKFLKADELKVYKLIWERFIACQMSDAMYDQTTVMIEAAGAKKHMLRASGQVMKFAGWLAARGQGEAVEEVAGEEAVNEPGAPEENSEGARTLPPMAKDERLAIIDPPGAVGEQKFTQPLPRYNEGTLVKALEDLGIGRPSTYAEIVTKVLSRDYVEKKDRQLVPTRLGTTKTHGLQKRFPTVVDYEFTAKIEKDLDEVEGGNEDWVKLVDRIYKPFKKIIDEEKKSKDPPDGWPKPEASDRICDKCGSPMVRRWGPNSDFFACTAYPACKNIVDEKPAPPPEVYKDRKCPRCGRDLLVKTRRGTDEKFLSCAGWKKKNPDCEYTAPFPTGIHCPKCGGDIVKVGSAKGRRPFWGCANYGADAKCDFKLYQQPVLEPCPKCGADFLVHAGGKTRPVLKCVKEPCDFSKPVVLADGEDHDEEAAPLKGRRGARTPATPEATP